MRDIELAFQVTRAPISPELAASFTGPVHIDNFRLTGPRLWFVPKLDYRNTIVAEVLVDFKSPSGVYMTGQRWDGNDMQAVYPEELVPPGQRRVFRDVACVDVRNQKQGPKDFSTMTVGWTWEE